VQLTKEMLSPAAKELNDKLGRRYVTSKKLVPNLNNKEKYVLHYRNLQLYLKHGLILTQIHRGIKFRQSSWLAPYIEKNTQLRQKARSSFEKDFFKLLNNSMFGKTMENLRQRVNIEIVSETKPAERRVSKHTCKAWEEINDDFTMVQTELTKIYWNKPTFIGFTVLELSKLHMYWFHYDVMKPKYDDKLKLLFTDTDSLCYEVVTNDLYADMQELKEHLDTSDYPQRHALYSKDNAKVIGKFKDENGSIPPVHFVGLRSKMYSIRTPINKAKFTAKGVKTSYALKHLTHEHYVKCLREGLCTSASYKVIRSRNHALRTEKVTKIALSSFDDKRYLLPNTGDTLAYGHCSIPR
jgi:hypothetical protein